MADTAQALIEAATANGYDTLDDRSIQECLLYAAQTGGGGSASFTQGDSDPVAPPTDPTQSALYWNRTSGVAFYWNTDTQAWE